MAQCIDRARQMVGVDGIVFFQVFADSDHSLEAIADEMLTAGREVTIDRGRNCVVVFQGDSAIGYSRHIPQLIRPNRTA